MARKPFLNLNLLEQISSWYTYEYDYHFVYSSVFSFMNLMQIMYRLYMSKKLQMQLPVTNNEGIVNVLNVTVVLSLDERYVGVATTLATNERYAREDSLNTLGQIIQTNSEENHNLSFDQLMETFHKNQE